MKNIIGIAGSIRSGKSSAAKILVEKFNYTSLSFGKMIENILSKDNSSTIRKSLQDKGLEIIKEIGYDGIAQLLLDTIMIENDSLIVIEGIRHADVCNYYKHKFGESFVFIYIDCPLEIRFERVKANPTKDQNIISLEGLKAVENHQVENGIQSLKEIADKIIDNRGSLDEFHKNLIEVLG